MLQRHTRVDGHSKLEFIDIKTNISSILLSLHRFDKTVKNKQQTDKQKIYKRKKKNKTKTMAALLLVRFWKFTKRKCVCPFLKKKKINYYYYYLERSVRLGVYCITMKNEAEHLQAY